MHAELARMHSAEPATGPALSVCPVVHATWPLPKALLPLYDMPGCLAAGKFVANYALPIHVPPARLARAVVMWPASAPVWPCAARRRGTESPPVHASRPAGRPRTAQPRTGPAAGGGGGAFMYPRGATLDVVPPAAAVLATGRLLHPPQCPVCARPRGPAAAALCSCSLRCDAAERIKCEPAWRRQKQGAPVRFPGRTANQVHNLLAPPRARDAHLYWLAAYRGRTAGACLGSPAAPWHTSNDPHFPVESARCTFAANAARAPGRRRAACALGQIL